MSQYPQDHGSGMPSMPPPQPLAPPTLPGAISNPHTKQVWPTVIGIVAIVFGVFGLFSGIWGTVSPFILGSLEGLTPKSEPDPFAAMRAWRVPMVVTGVLSTLAAGLLLAGGVVLIMRRSAASPMLVGWAVLRMLTGAAAAVVAALMQKAQMDDMMAHMNATNPQAAAGAAAMMSGVSMAMLVVMLVFGILWSWALPIFMLIWFTRKGVKMTVQGWRDERAGLVGAGA